MGGNLRISLGKDASIETDNHVIDLDIGIDIDIPVDAGIVYRKSGYQERRREREEFQYLKFAKRLRQL